MRKAIPSKVEVITMVALQEALEDFLFLYGSETELKGTDTVHDLTAASIGDITGRKELALLLLNRLRGCYPDNTPLSPSKFLCHPYGRGSKRKHGYSYRNEEDRYVEMVAKTIGGEE